LANSHELAYALGVWAMVFLGISIIGAFAILEKRRQYFQSVTGESLLFPITPLKIQ